MDSHSFTRSENLTDQIWSRYFRISCVLISLICCKYAERVVHSLGDNSKSYLKGVKEASKLVVHQKTRSINSFVAPMLCFWPIRSALTQQSIKKKLLEGRAYWLGCRHPWIIQSIRSFRFKELLSSCKTSVLTLTSWQLTRMKVCLTCTCFSPRLKIAYPMFSSKSALRWVQTWKSTWETGTTCWTFYPTWEACKAFWSVFSTQFRL